MTRTLTVAWLILGLAFAQTTFAETALQSDQPLRGSVMQGQWQYYEFMPSGDPAVVSVELYEIAMDVDLFLGLGERPNRLDYACRQAVFGQRLEVCKLPIDDATPIYVGVYGYQGGDYRLRLTVQPQVVTAAVHETR